LQVDVCINIYAIDIIILHLVLKMKSEHIRHCLLFCLHQKKSAADAHRFIYETYSENVVAIRTCANCLNDFKTMISISVTKNALDVLQLWKRTNCGKIRKSHGKRWKILWLI